MCMKRAEVAVGAYVQDPDGALFRIDRIPSTNGRTRVLLEDVACPTTSERLPDPQVPGRLGASAVLSPRVVELALNEVMRSCYLVRHAPCEEDTASEAEYGRCGTAPE